MPTRVGRVSFVPIFSLVSVVLIEDVQEGVGDECASTVVAD